jgi:hypothetical protein
MATSRSVEGEEGWIAGVSVFSGRPDPIWPVPSGLGTRLAQLWEELPEWSGERPVPPPLGYRGGRLTAPDGRVWRAFRELVSLGPEDRRDGGREFERTLLASAPPGMLPPIEM